MYRLYLHHTIVHNSIDFLDYPIKFIVYDYEFWFLRVTKIIGFAFSYRENYRYCLSERCFSILSGNAKFPYDISFFPGNGLCQIEPNDTGKIFIHYTCKLARLPCEELHARVKSTYNPNRLWINQRAQKSMPVASCRMLELGFSRYKWGLVGTYTTNIKNNKLGSLVGTYWVGTHTKVYPA